ncbi:MAG: hypothetical protein JWM11_5867 [Planctomycetaceae bacterium]|nr:hypothetical protein [Planctomycetaceae bacterium]
MALPRNWTVVCGVALCYSLTGCGGGKEDFKSAKDVNKDRSEIVKKKEEDKAHAHEHEHHHHAPHHGSLTMLGDHVAQLELTIDAEAGKLTVYVLDGEAEKSLAVDQAVLEVAVTLDGATEPLALKLAPAEAAKQDEGFVGQNDKLKGIKKLKGTIASLKLKGKDKPDEKIAVEFDAQKAEAEAEEAHKHGDEKHDHKAEGKAKPDHDHDDKDHKHEEKAAAPKDEKTTK